MFPNPVYLSVSWSVLLLNVFHLILPVLVFCLLLLVCFAFASFWFVLYFVLFRVLFCFVFCFVFCVVLCFVLVCALFFLFVCFVVVFFLLLLSFLFIFFLQRPVCNAIVLHASHPSTPQECVSVHLPTSAS